MFSKYFLIFIFIGIVAGNKIIIKRDNEKENFKMIRNIIDSSEDKKGWTNFLVVGDWPDSFFETMQGLPFTFVLANDNYKKYIIDEKLKYAVNCLVLECSSFVDFEKKMKIIIDIPYWHPLTNTIVYYHNATESNEIKARIFYALWYYRSSNSIMIQYGEGSDLYITYFNQYISENYRLEHHYGCWTRSKITIPVRDLQKGLICTEECHNITTQSKLRADNLGTCIGLKTIKRSDSEINMNLFEDKAKNLNKFPLRTFAREVKPFLRMDVDENGTYNLYAREGFLWNTMAEMMNFTFDLSPNAKTFKCPFDFEHSITQVSNIDRRKGELLLLPIYLFDLIVVQVDMTYPYKESGMCFLSHRAGFETTFFDVKLLISNYTIVIRSVFCFFATWFVFFIFNIAEKNVITYDQAGKDFINAFRSFLSLSLYKPPKRSSFKIFLLVSIWSFFVINFATQAAITSFFSTIKTGKEVETFDDVIEKGYVVEGLASPDIMLPQTEDKFRKINAKLVPISDLYGCMTNMINDSRRFCLIDCALGHYVERNMLNDKGEQYLHIAKDQIHSYYLTMIFSKYSTLTDEYNRNIMKILEGGLVNKWEQYRYADIKYETPVKSLDMNSLSGIFKCYSIMIGLSMLLFVIEVVVGAGKNMKNFFKTKLLKWKRTRAVKKLLDLERKQGKIKLSNNSTQTL